RQGQVLCLAVRADHDDRHPVGQEIAGGRVADLLTRQRVEPGRQLLDVIKLEAVEGDVEHDRGDGAAALKAEGKAADEVALGVGQLLFLYEFTAETLDLRDDALHGALDVDRVDARVCRPESTSQARLQG